MQKGHFQTWTHTVEFLKGLTRSVRSVKEAELLSQESPKVVMTLHSKTKQNPKESTTEMKN